MRSYVSIFFLQTLENRVYTRRGLKLLYNLDIHRLSLIDASNYVRHEIFWDGKDTLVFRKDFEYEK